MALSTPLTDELQLIQQEVTSQAARDALWAVGADLARLREIERIVRYVTTETYAGANDELLLLAQGRAFRKMVRWLEEVRFP